MNRDIYQYEGDDGAILMGDPIRILNVLTDVVGGDLAAVVAAVESPAPQISAGAQISLDRAARAAFRLRDYDPETGSGKTMGEVAETLAAFFEWRDEKKKPCEPSPTSPACAAPPGP